MEKKFKPIGDGIIDNQGLLLEKTGNVGNLLGATLHEIVVNSNNVLKKTSDSELKETTIEIQFEKSGVVMKNNSELNITAFSFSEL